MSYRYRTLDVFTQTPFEGNPLAVFPEAQGIDDATMQRIARELNLSETVFVLPPRDRACVVRARIFTPTAELPFAGHPTVGTAYVLADEGVVSADVTRFSIEESIGPVPVRLERDARSGEVMAWLQTPPIAFGAVLDGPRCAQALGLAAGDLVRDVPVQSVSAGVSAAFVAVRDPVAVDAAVFDAAKMRTLLDSLTKETFVFAPVAAGAYARMFAPDLGIAEDPATGGVTGPLAAFMMRYGLVAPTGGTRFVSEQGVKMGRRSLLHVLVHGAAGSDGIEVGGFVTPVAEGTMRPGSSRRC